MVQVASCEQALVNQIENQFKTHQSKTMFLFKTYTMELSLTDTSSTWLAIREYRVGFSVFLVGDSRFLCQNDCLGKPEFPYFSNCKHQEEITLEQNMIISSYLLMANQLSFTSGLFIKLKT